MIAIIGPTLPFRGGIAQHTTMLHRALKEIVDIKTVSFKRQYPKFIFPGKSDKDDNFDGYKEQGVEYLIDSINPLTWNKAVSFLVENNTRQVIFPWWTVYWAPCFGYIAKKLKEKKIKVTFFCHNVIEHESSYVRERLTKTVLNLGDQFIVHTNEDCKNLKNIFPNAEIVVHPHPIYDQFPENAENLPRRASLELLFFGFVRPYKGLDILIDALGEISKQDFFLSIVGEFWADKDLIRKKIIENGIEDKVEIVDTYVSDKQAASFFQRTDAVVLPYRSATGSGVVALAYHYQKPVIASEVGGLPDVVEHGHTGFLVEPGDVKALSEIISKLTSEDCINMKSSIVEKSRAFTWESLATAIVC